MAEFQQNLETFLAVEPFVARVVAGRRLRRKRNPLVYVRRQVAVTAPNGITSYSFDPANRLTNTLTPTLGMTIMTYDDDGRRTSTTDPRGQVTSWGYTCPDLPF